MQKRFSCLLLVLLAATLPGCDRAKHTAKDTIRKTGEAVGQSATVLADGLATGAAREAARIELSPALQGRGLQVNRASADRPADSVRTRSRLTLYVVFNQPFADSVRVRLLDNQGLEYGRQRFYLTGRRDDARPVQVLLDPRIDFELSTRVLVE